jgi:hypothetical protein
MAAYSTHRRNIEHFDTMRCADRKSVGEIINEKHVNERPVFMPQNHIRVIADCIRMKVDRQNATMQIPTNFLSVATGNMQSIFASATALIQEMANGMNQIVRNVR